MSARVYDDMGVFNKVRIRVKCDFFNGISCQQLVFYCEYIVFNYWHNEITVNKIDFLL
jgi:hypothetical protein